MIRNTASMPSADLLISAQLNSGTMLLWRWIFKVTATPCSGGVDALSCGDMVPLHTCWHWIDARFAPSDSDTDIVHGVSAFNWSKLRVWCDALLYRPGECHGHNDLDHKDNNTDGLSVTQCWPNVGPISAMSAFIMLSRRLRAPRDIFPVKLLELKKNKKDLSCHYKVALNFRFIHYA